VNEIKLKWSVRPRVMAFLQSMIHFTVNNSIRHVSTTAQNSTGCCTVVSQLCERKVDEKNQTDELSH